MKVLCKDGHYRKFEKEYVSGCMALLWHCKSCNEQIGLSSYPNIRFMKNHICKVRLKELK